MKNLGKIIIGTIASVGVSAAATATAAVIIKKKKGNVKATCDEAETQVADEAVTEEFDTAAIESDGEDSTTDIAQEDETAD